MGTTGGKIGFVTGIPVAFLSAEPMIQLFVDPCFFEQGCEGAEGAMLWLAGVGALALGVAAGLLVRAFVNCLLANG